MDLLVQTVQSVVVVQSAETPVDVRAAADTVPRLVVSRVDWLTTPAYQHSPLLPSTHNNNQHFLTSSRLQCFDAVGWVAGRTPACKKLSGWMLAWLPVWSKVQICIWPSWCHCHSLSLAPANPDWFYLSGTSVAVVVSHQWGCTSLNENHCLNGLRKIYYFLSNNSNLNETKRMWKGLI